MWGTLLYPKPILNGRPLGSWPLWAGGVAGSEPFWTHSGCTP